MGYLGQNWTGRSKTRYSQVLDRTRKLAERTASLQIYLSLTKIALRQLRFHWWQTRRAMRPMEVGVEEEPSSSGSRS